MNKPLKISLITIGSLVGLVLLAVLFVLLFGGSIGRKVVEKHSPQWVGRQILLDDARINLFAGSVDLYNVRMLEADNATDFVRFDSLYAQIKLLNLLKKDVHLIDIYQMAIGQKINPSVAPYKAIPVKLAVGILTDIDGKIELDVPVSGSSHFV